MGRFRSFSFARAHRGSCLAYCKTYAAHLVAHARLLVVPVRLGWPALCILQRICQPLPPTCCLCFCVPWVSAFVLNWRLPRLPQAAPNGVLELPDSCWR